MRRRGANLIQSLPAPELEWQWSADQVKAAWDRAAAGDVTPQLTEYLVRQIRLWRPELVVLADPGPQSPGVTQLTHRIALRAVELSADPQQFPEQIQRAGLPAWRVARVATQTDDLTKAGYKVTASRQSLAWGQSVGSIADRARSLIDHTYQPGAAQLGLIVADGQAARAERGSDLLAARTARERQALQRPEGRLPDNLQQLHDQYQGRRNIESLLRSSDEIPAARWPQIARLSEGLSPADRGEVLYQAAMQALRRGNAPLAWDLLTQLTREIPDHPLAEAARLELFRRAASVEASLHWPMPTTSRAEQTVGELPVSEPAASIDLTSLQTPAAATDPPAAVQTTQQAVGQADTATPQTLRLADQLREQQPDLYFEPCVRFPLAAALLRGTTARGDSAVAQPTEHRVGIHLARVQPGSWLGNSSPARKATSRSGGAASCLHHLTWMDSSMRHPGTRSPGSHCSVIRLQRTRPARPRSGWHTILVFSTWPHAVAAIPRHSRSHRPSRGSVMRT